MALRGLPGRHGDDGRGWNIDGYDISLYNDLQAARGGEDAGRWMIPGPRSHVFWADLDLNQHRQFGSGDGTIPGSLRRKVRRSGSPACRALVRGRLADITVIRATRLKLLTGKRSRRSKTCSRHLFPIFPSIQLFRCRIQSNNPEKW